MNVINHSESTSSLLPSFLKPYINALENVGIMAENITRTGVVITEAALGAAELSKAMVQLRLDEVAKELSARPSLT